MRNFARKIGYYLIDPTALLVSTSPFQCASETLIAGMSDEVSLHTRLYVTGTCYLGLGRLIGKGRDMSRKMLNITDTTSEVVQQIHDSLYLASTNFVLSPVFYAAAGETNVKKMLIGAVMSSGIGLITGPLAGYSVDAFRDLTGLEDCERKTYPNYVRCLPSKAKKTLAAGLVAVAIGIIGLIYHTTPDKKEQLAQVGKVSHFNNNDADKYMEHFVQN